MIPLAITATLSSPLGEQLYPLAIDALLAAAICEENGWIAGVGEWHDVEVPLARSPCGRFHLASVAHYRVARYLQGYVHKRAPVPEYMALGGPKIRRVDTGTGANKSFRIPQPRAILASRMSWWAVGDPTEVERLLALITHVGKKRSVGFGRIAKWYVEPMDATWPGFPVLRHDGTPMRNLPVDYPGVSEFADRRWGPVSYPYYDHGRSTEVACPPDVEWGANAGAWYVSSHAADRFLERHDQRTGCTSVEQALLFIAADQAAAVPAHAGHDGAEVWVGRRPWRIRYVLDQSLAEHPCPAVVTVLPTQRKADS